MQDKKGAYPEQDSGGDRDRQPDHQEHDRSGHGPHREAESALEDRRHREHDERSGSLEQAEERVRGGHRRTIHAGYTRCK